MDRRRILRWAAWASLAILVAGNLALMFPADAAKVHHLMRFQIGRHDYVVEEYQGSLLASRALAGGEFSVEHRDGEISLVGIERNVSRWQATTIAIPYLIVSVFTSIWAVKYLWKHRRTAAK